MDTTERITFLREWADRWGLDLQLHGSVGFGRDCVGLVKSGSYVDYDHIYSLDPKLQFWTPEDAYHKHYCLAVLGRGDYATGQLYDWVKWIDDNGWAVETVERESSSAVDAFFHGVTITRLAPPPFLTMKAALAEVERLKAENVKLQKDSDFLNNLRAAGVDNWDGYHHGFGDDEDDEDE